MKPEVKRQAQTLVIAAIFSVLTSAQAIFIIVSKRDSSTYSFSTTMLNCLTEFLKLLISFSLLAYNWTTTENGWHKDEFQFDWGIPLLHYLVPAVMYAFKNILQFSAALYMDAPTYQVLKNLNIIATGILYYFTFGRQLDRRQMECMLLLLIGVSLIQIKPGESYFENSSMWGLFICVMMAILSAGAGIYTELIIKRAQEKSLHVQNIQLYAFGMMCNVLLYWFWEDTAHLGNFFEGLLSFKSICVITTTVLSGLSVSMLLKYADNIVKVYSSGLSVIFTAFYCMLYLDFDPTLLFWCGTLVIVVSIDIYYMKMAGGGGGAAAAASTPPPPKEKEKDGLSDILVDKDAADKK